MHSQKTIVYAIIAALIGVLAIGGLLSINHSSEQQLPAAVHNTAVAEDSVAPTLNAASPQSGGIQRGNLTPNGATTQNATPPFASSQQSTGAEQSANATQASNTANTEPSWPREITDSRGAATTLAHRPQRIISLAPSVTQTLRAIGAEGALVAIPREGSDPSEAAELARISVYPAPSAEAILALQPDLLLGADITSPAVAERLRSFGLSLIILGGGDYNGILADINRAGQATGHEETATILVQALTAQRDAVQAEVAAVSAHNPASESHAASDTGHRPQVLLFIGQTPDYAAGAGSYSASLLQIAGGENLAEKLKQPWPLLSREFILEANPHLLIFTSEAAAISSPAGSPGRSEAIAAYLRNDPVWSNLDAVRNNRIYAIDQNLLNVPGPHVGEALTQLRTIIRHTEQEAAAASPHVEMSSGHFQR